jgi:DNA-binding MarR family transcriptional regulator
MSDWPTGRLLSTASRLVEHAWLDALTALGLSHAGLIVLHLLENGPVTQVELAGTARVEAQTMSRTVERLEREGYVSRHPDAADRRRRLVQRTPAGAEVFARAHLIEAELFPEVGDLPALRSALLGIIGSSSGGRWNEARLPEKPHTGGPQLL